MSNDLKMIKKKYGEGMMHFCRENFSSLLETEGLLPSLLLEHFDPSHILFEDIKKEDLEGNFKDYIYSLVDVKKDREITIDKTCEQLMDEAGYTLVECATESDIQSFKKYYREDEELCTFWTHRLNNCRVFFAVKKDVDKIKRENFKNPERQDLYGTSVISIQFTKDGTNTLSIKNRYNHTVDNPDATFSNNLDNIIPGLTESFEKEYGIIQKYKNDNFEITNYVRANDGKFYKFNYEIGGIHYCPNNIVINQREVIRYPKEKYIVFDYFVLDLVNKKLLYDIDGDAFVDTITAIEKIKIETKKDSKILYLQSKEQDDIIITLDKENKIIGYQNNTIERIGDNFLYLNEALTDLWLPNLKKVGSEFLYHNLSLEHLNLPKVEFVKDAFLFCNEVLNSIELPQVKIIGSVFLYYNSELTRLQLPNLKMINNNFLSYNRVLSELSLPNLKRVENNFLCHNKVLTKVNLPNLTIIGSCFLYKNGILSDLYLPQVKYIDNYFLYANESLEKLNLPSVEEVGIGFLSKNKYLKELFLPKVRKIDYYFMGANVSLTELSLPSVEIIDSKFLAYNKVLKKVELPNLKTVGNSFLVSNEALEKLDLPNAEIISNSFLFHNKQLRELSLPKVREIDCKFLYSNISLTKLSLPQLEKAENLFLADNQSLEEINIPETAIVDAVFKEKYENLFENSERFLKKKVI